MNEGKKSINVYKVHKTARRVDIYRQTTDKTCCPSCASSAPYYFSLSLKEQKEREREKERGKTSVVAACVSRTGENHVVIGRSALTIVNFTSGHVVLWFSG